MDGTAKGCEDWPGKNLQIVFLYQLYHANIEYYQVSEDSGDILISATGILNAWKWPDIPGLFNFKGHIVHTANWDDSYDLKGKKVALIGGGSSGIQLLPEIQPIVERCDHYMKGKTWIAYRVPGKEYPGMNPEDLENCKCPPVEDILLQLV